jgi:outer membrane protein assembly factor BamB
MDSFEGKLAVVPGPDLYTDSVVKLSPQGKLLWYHQLTPHDLYDRDPQNSFHGDLYALNAATGAVLLRTPMSAGSNAPVTIDGDYVITGAGAPLYGQQKSLIIAYKLGGARQAPRHGGRVTEEAENG